MKKFGVASAVALSLVMSQFAVTTASAEQTAAHFRAPAAQTFSASDLQSYGMTADAANRAVDLQNHGYQLKVLTPAEAQRYQAGISDNQWIWLGILAGVIIIAVAVAD